MTAIGQRPATTTAAHDHGHEGWIVGLVAACVFMSVTNTTMVNVALPTIGDDFDAGPSRLGWLVTAYSLAFGVGTPFYGRLGDRYGLRRVFLVGLCIFVAASLLAGVAPTFELLLIFRALQAIGSAAIPSLGTAMIARVVPEERRGRSLGVTSMSVGLGSALGPTLGGAMTQLISWRTVFLISALLAVVIPLVLRYLPAAPGDRSGSVDWFGGITLGASISGLLLATTGIQRQGAADPMVLGTLGLAVVAGCLTVWRQRVARSPFVPRELVANRRYLLLCVVGFCAMAGSVGSLVVQPFLFRDVNGLSTGAIGLALLPSALAVAVLSRPAGRLADRHDPYLLVGGGLLVAIVTLLLLAMIAIGWPAVAFAALATFLGAGQAFYNAPLTTALTRSMSRHVYGAGLGVYNMLFFVGAGFGASVSTAVIDLREGASSPILPVYAGSQRFVEFSDALLPSAALFLVALLAVQLARRAGRTSGDQPAPSHVASGSSGQIGRRT
jgi:EmrB/QacA subfamily drug resistance transporter